MSAVFKAGGAICAGLGVYALYVGARYGDIITGAAIAAICGLGMAISAYGIWIESND